jgi:hypothetical protein
MLEELVSTNVYVFGAEVCEVNIFRQRLGTMTAYMALAYVQEDYGQTLREVGDKDGMPVAGHSGNPVFVLEQMRCYLESRFGPPEPKPDFAIDPALDFRPIVEPPLRDSRPRH